MQRDLTEKQKSFAIAIANGQRPKDAARSAGYLDPGPDAWRQHRNPRVLELIHKERQRRLTELANKSIQFLEELMDDDEAPQKLKFEASKTILDRAGHSAQAADEERKATSKEQELSEMTNEELDEYIRKARDAQASNEGAVVIDVDPPDDDPQTT